MEIMGGMIRMQLMADFCRRLEDKEIIDAQGYHDVHLAGNMRINGGHPWPFEAILDELEERGIDRKRIRHELRCATANSTAISYLQMGRPETIIVHPDERFEDSGEDAA
jgi:hypothetical protein